MLLAEGIESSYGQTQVLWGISLDVREGEIVALTFDAETEATQTVSSRRTGAVLINTSLDGLCEIHWTVTGTTLSAVLNTGRSGTLEFWVF